MRYLLPSVWAEVERLYFEGVLSVGEIAAKVDIRRDSIYKRAKSRGWPTHRQLRVDGTSSERAVLRRIIAKKLAKLEARMDDSEPATEADSERQVRSVASLLNSVDKLDVKEKNWRDKIITPSTGKPAAANTISYGEDDVEQWRAELARRINALWTDQPG
jgi:hypothetical protein